MADEYDLEAVVRFTAEGQQAVRAALGGVQRELDALHKTGKITDATHDHLATTLTKTGQAADRQLGRGAQNAGAAIQKMGSAAKEANGNLPRLRYALYDVASTAQIAGIALLGMSTAIAAVSIKFDRDFADVQRTSGATGHMLSELRKEFDALYSALPVSFADLAQIGTLGGQLNIASSRLAKFTEYVAKFSATSNVSVEAAATAFGRLDQLLPDVQGNYEALSDAILKVGINSVATEDQIIAITTQLAGVATTANLSSQELIALSGTLASLGTAPELARGTITRLFANIETAIAGGGERLQAFSQASGRTAQQFREDWGTDSYSVIVDLFDNLGTSGANLGNELRRLGITASRDIPVFQKLAQNSQMLKDTFEDASNSAGETAAQYSIITSTIAEKINVLVNNFNLLIDAMGSSTSLLGGFIDLAIGLLRVLEGIVSTPAGQVLAGLSLILGALGGAALLALGVFTRYLASVAAVATASKELGATNLGLIGTFRALTAEISANTAAMNVNAGAAGKLKGALGKAGLIGVIATLLTVSAATFQGFQSFAADTQLAMQGLTAETQEWAKAISEADFSKIETVAQRASSGWNSMLGAAGGDLDNFIGFLDSLGGGYSAKLQGELLEIDSALSAFAQSGNAVAATERLEELRRIMVDEGSWSNEAFNETFSQTIAVLGEGSLAAEQAAHSFGILESEIYDLISTFTDVVQGSIDVQSSIYDLGQALGENGAAFDDFSVAGRQNMAALLDTIDAVARQTPGDAASTAANLQALYDTLVQGAGVSASSLVFLAQTISALRAAAGGGSAAATLDFGGLFAGMSKGSDKAAASLGRVGRAAGGAAKQVRTLVDYANDLQSVFSRSFDIRFKSQLAMDDVADSWEALAKRIDDARIKLLGLQADKSIAEYFKSVADQYGDTLRGDKLAAEIADLNKEIADAQAEASTNLKGNTKGARDNRKTLADLVKKYQDYITALAASGADQKTLNAAIAKSKAEFLAQAQALGYSNAQLKPYVASFNDMATAIARIPRNITVAANPNPALQALNEFMAKAKATIGGGVSVPISTMADTSGAKKVIRAEIAALNAALIAEYARLGGNGNARTTGLQAAIKKLQAQLAGFATGGYTGRGGKYEPAGVVHRGEYVVPKEQVDQRTGLPYASALGNLQAGSRAPRSSYATGGYVGGGLGGVVVLDQAQYNGLVRAMRASGNNVNAQSIQGIVNTLNSQSSNLGRA